MAIKIILSSDENGKITVELAENGGGNVEFHGGSFWQRSFPSDVTPGEYDEVVFDATLFKGQPSPKGIVSFKKAKLSSAASGDAKGPTKEEKQ